MALETAKQAIDTIHDALNIFGKIFNRVKPWKGSRKSLSMSDEKSRKSFEEYSPEIVTILDNMQAQLLNITDAYNSTMRSVFEWCKRRTIELPVYMDLFNDGNAYNQAVQKKVIVTLLQNSKQMIEMTQPKLNSCVENLRKISEQLATLEIQLSKDFDENGKYFRRKLAQILNENSSASDFWFFCCGIGIMNKNKSELKRKLREKFNSIRQMWGDSKVKVDQALIDVKHAKEKLMDKLQMIDEQISRVSETKTYVVDDSNAKLRDSVIASANTLIANCIKFLENHSQKRRSAQLIQRRSG